MALERCFFEAPDCLRRLYPYLLACCSAINLGILDVTAANPPETLDNLDSLSSFLAEFIPEAKPVPNPIKVELSEIPLSL